MKTAIILHGNLRTFFMPLRESAGRLCDSFMKNIVIPNNADVFIFTDTNDFYHNGVQYYATDRRIEILNDNAYRLYHKVDFISNDQARHIINEEINALGPNIKAINVEDPFDATTDPKFKILNDANVKGSSPELLIHQFRKLKLCYEMIKTYEQENNFKYELLVKWRPDISAPNYGELKFHEYDYVNNDIYVAGNHSPIIYDWHAFGRPRPMDYCLSLYDRLGNYLHEGLVFICDKCRYYGEHNVCQMCGKIDYMSEITLAPEYHLFRIYKENNIKIRNSGYDAYPYRYKNTNVNTPIDEVMNELNINATLVTYSTGIDIKKTLYKERK